MRAVRSGKPRDAFQNEVDQARDIGRMDSWSWGAHREDPHLLRCFHGLGIEVPHDFHVIADKAQRHDEDGFATGSGKQTDGVVHVRFQPRNLRGPTAGLEDELPRRGGAAELGHDDVGYGAMLRHVRAAGSKATLGRARAVRIGSGDGVGGEKNLHLGFQIDAGELCFDGGKAIPNALNKRRDKTRVIEELTDLVNLQRLAKTRVFKTVGQILAVLAAAGERAVGTGGKGEQAVLAGIRSLGQGFIDIRSPVAVAPEHGKINAPRRQLSGERCLQLTVVLVDGADAIEVTVVMGNLFETFVGDAATAGDIAQKWDDVILALGATKTHHPDAVIVGGLLNPR